MFIWVEWLSSMPCSLQNVIILQEGRLALDFVGTYLKPICFNEMHNYIFHF